MWLSRIVKSCMDIVLPPGCPVCRVKLPVAWPKRLCHQCSSAIQFLHPPFCRICGIEISEVSDNGYHPLCAECLSNPPPFAIARSVVRYEEQVKKLIHNWKYSSDLSMVPGLCELISCYDMAEFADIDRVVVVPLHLHRLRHRGFNQAVVLARLFFADRADFIRPDWLFRTRNTVPQTELGKEARRTNLCGAFQVRSTADLAGRRVCLIDDVFTTGTTVKECSKALMEGGAVEVRVLTLARVNLSLRGRHRRAI